MGNKLPIEFVQNAGDDFFLNQRGAKVFYDESRQPLLPIAKGKNVYKVLSIGFGNTGTPMVTIESGRETVCYKLPYEYSEWAMTVVGCAKFDVCEVKDVFTGKPVNTKQYDIDHFIPWSFVMNDELWNLMPMDSSLNSSKNNRLPKWKPFFEIFAGNQFILYEKIYEMPELHKLFEACYRDNLHSIWAVRELYTFGKNRQEFCHILEKNMQPVYDSARRQGYEIWNRDKVQ